MTFLLSGHTIKDIEIKTGTIKGYMDVINKYYKQHNFNEPFDPESDSGAARLLREQKKFEQDPERRAPLPDMAYVKMHELAREDPLGLRAAIFDIAALGRLGGFRQQEYAMDTKTKIKTYLLPNGTEVTRAFCLKNILFRDKEKRRIHHPLLQKGLIAETGQQYDVQKNRRNGQIIWMAEDKQHKVYCPVELSLSLVWRAETLGQGPEDPLCVYKGKTNKVEFLTGKEVTEYFRFIVKLTNPSITNEELKLISTHSIRVTACVLLAEAGKEGWYIKLRLRWLSDCYEVYIRDTSRLALMHNEALCTVNDRLEAVPVTPTNLPEIIEESGIIDCVPYELEDED